MYQQFFNFKTAPFSIAPDPHYIYMSGHHQEGLAHLLYAINNGGGFVALTGEVGTGKTMLCHYLLEELPENVEMALVLNPKLNTIELLATICDELQISYDHEHLSIKGLIDSLNEYLLEAHSLGWMTVLLIDEAQNLSLDVLEQIRLLTNLETNETKLLQIILVGQPELKKLLEKPELRQLNQRITARYHLDPLSFSDAQNYIKHRLKLSGGYENIFSQRAIRQIYKLSGGIPRLINILSDRALLGAYVANTHTITAKIVKKAAKEVFNSSKVSANVNTLASLIIIAILALTVYFFLPVKASKKHLVLSGSFQKPAISKTQKPISVIAEKKKVPELYSQEELAIKEQIRQSQAKPLDFTSAINQQKLNINLAISKLARLWNKDILMNSGCVELEQVGLRCLLDRTSWKNLIILNKPVIMEFNIAKNEKYYALLIGLKNGNPVFKFEDERVFPVEKVLSLWDGYYLMFWQPPIKNIDLITLGFSSEVVVWIRKQLIINKHKLRTANSVYFDKQLQNEIIKFQKQHHLTADGIVGPRTFIHLSHSDPQNNSPKLKLQF